MAAAKVRLHIKNLNLILNDHTFDSTDGIHALDFLAIFLNNANILNRSETDAFIAFPSLPSKPTKTQFCTNLSEASREGGVTCWM